MRAEFFGVAERKPTVPALSDDAGGGLPIPMRGFLPSEDDEFALEFLHDCGYNVPKASLLLAAIAGGGHEVSALRHIEAARSHIMGGKVSRLADLTIAAKCAAHAVPHRA